MLGQEAKENPLMKLIAACLSAILAVSAAEAADDPVVVELFTSQGCSSCPPADDLLRELATRDDVLPLALHVDYWDYIGWKDPFANPAFTKRQKAYARAGGRRMIYTPQMIVNGTEDLVGVKTMELADLIMAHKAAPTRVALTANRDGATLTIRLAPADQPLKGPLTVHLVRFVPLQTTEITRGENAGRTIDYANVVSNWAVLGQWDGSSETELSADVDGPDQVAVLVQSGTTGPIMAAARP
jgi:hypothetical protein